MCSDLYSHTYSTLSGRFAPNIFYRHANITTPISQCLEMCPVLTYCIVSVLSVYSVPNSYCHAYITTRRLYSARHKKYASAGEGVLEKEPLSLVPFETRDSQLEVLSLLLRQSLAHPCSVPPDANPIQTQLATNYSQMAITPNLIQIHQSKQIQSKLATNSNPVGHGLIPPK
jgi:hypothetical protein